MRYMYVVMLAAAALVACGDVKDLTDAPPGVDSSSEAVDAPEIDSSSQTIDATSDPDGNQVVIDATSIDAASCVWINVVQCDTQGTITQFCPSGTHVGQLRRCDGVAITPPAGYADMYRLCSCNTAACGCSQIGVVFQQVECCNN